MKKAKIFKSQSGALELLFTTLLTAFLHQETQMTKNG